MYAKNGFIDKVWALFMGHTVPYTFVFKPQIYVLDLPLSYGHSYLYALCMRVINLKIQNKNELLQIYLCYCVTSYQLYMFLHFI